MPDSMASRWLHPVARDPLRSLRIVRGVVAVVLASHPAYAVSHPADLQLAADALAAHGVPGALGLAWAAMLGQLACALALLAGRRVVAACAGSLIVLATGCWLFYAPAWYVAGGGVGDQLGMEFNVLLMTCLAGVLWAHAPRRAAAGPPPDPAIAAGRGLAVIRVGAGLLLLAHPMHAFMTWDVAGMREWGESMSARGFPYGVPLVWTVISLQALGCLALAARRLVVPASVGLCLVLATGIWLVHFPRWYIVGPGENGMELPVVYIACFVACIVGYAPARGPRAVTARRQAASA